MKKYWIVPRIPNEILLVRHQRRGGDLRQIERRLSGKKRRNDTGFVVVFYEHHTLFLLVILCVIISAPKNSLKIPLMHYDGRINRYGTHHCVQYLHI